VGIDYYRAINVRNDIQHAADSASLVVARTMIAENDEAKAKEIGKKLYAANLSNKILKEQGEPIFEITTNSGGQISVNTTVSGGLNTSIMQLAGHDKLDIEVNSSVSVALPKVEISMVLDVSHSMRRPSRIGGLRTAASSFIDVINPSSASDSYRVVSIIPFSTTVNMGAGFTDLLGAGTAAFPNSDFVGCYDPEEDAVLRSSNLSPVLADNNPATGLLAYENTIRDDGTPLCPPESSKVELFSDDSVVLKNKVRDMQLGFGTGTDVALSWGWRSLSPQWRGTLPGSNRFPADFGAGKKILVLLTDGRIIRRRWVDKGRGRKGQIRYTNEAEANFVSMCSSIKAQGEIKVFMIGYDFTTLDPSLRTMLQNCASNGGAFYEANSSNLNEIFSEIASQISDIRLTN